MNEIIYDARKIKASDPLIHTDLNPETGNRPINIKIRTCHKGIGIPILPSGAISFHFFISRIQVGEFSVSSVPI